VYLFAHSSNNFWELGKYSSVFNLTYKLNIKDQINLFYEGRRYIYEIENKLLVNDFKVDETAYEYLGPTLTLQTCYPTGTSLYRLIIRATLVGVYDYSN
jgi:sortase (surface protein transpeptidase)